MNKEKALAAQRKGGRRSWESGKAHKWTPETAVLANRKRNNK